MCLALDALAGELSAEQRRVLEAHLGLGGRRGAATSVPENPPAGIGRALSLLGSELGRSREQPGVVLRLCRRVGVP